MFTCLIIGASSGIGLQLAVQLIDSGHQVYATYFKNRVQSDNVKIQYNYLNVMDEELRLDFLPESLAGLQHLKEQ